ncbi:hypothetical protein BCR36DRAFT_582746 [Piromyces finnis]|uniref:DUF567-domain-containing protein n=1 Tax=Piromyces finnis TaxID=1754191 RepID=A0A1Y1VBW0_9FUNG|nr:hypothetical protein BCR36DRAFT_582746 [Piromyces finnis]|eukprot:ORX52247.1 hypothetical protein BCR36DRAFT_582746 [Piromyces finnis]
MFLMKSYAQREVSSAQRPIICTEQRFAFNQEITLCLDEKRSFSGDDFAIKDQNGVSYFKCKGKTFSIRDKKVIYDLYDKPIFNIQENAFFGHGQKIYSGKSTDEILGSVHRVSMLKKNKYQLSFRNLATGQEEVLDIKCDFIGNSCGIFCGKEKEGAPMICRIIKSKKLASLISDRDHYKITIAPNVDAALMVALTIIYDELKHEEE